MQRISVLSALVVFLSAASAHATTITINDSFPDNHVGLTILFTADTTNGIVSANCSVAGVNQWNCSEAAPIVLTADIVRSGSALNDSNFNIWDDVIGGTISDTLSFAFSSVTSTTAHAAVTFRSGAGVTAFSPAGNTFDAIEGPPVAVNLNGSQLGGTLTVVTTPEPATLTLTAIGLAGVITRYRRRHSNLSKASV